MLRLSVANRSLGTVPIVYQADNIVVAAAEDDSDGFGLLIVPAPAGGTNARQDPDTESYAEADIRLLGPRQSCGHSFEVEASAAMIDAGGSARAWYRMSAPGVHQPSDDDRPPLFPDQGLAMLTDDVVYSEEVAIAART